MAGATRGLGRGLDALLGGGTSENRGKEKSMDVRYLDIDLVIANPNQPRKDFSPEALEELTESIKAKGVLQPVLVRPFPGDRNKYELVAGERRLRASKLAGLTEIPAMVKDMTDLESMAVALIENLQREDLNPIEEAKGYQELTSKFGLSQEELGRQVGKSRSALANSMRLLSLPDDIQSAIGKNEISAGHGRSLMSVTDDEARAELFERIVTYGYSVRQTEKEASFWKENGELPPVDNSTNKKKAAKKKPVKKEKDEELETLRDRLEKNLETKIKISGTKEKGKLTISYSDSVELERLVAILELRS
ncbi:ParB/RepB/Spo0J family partition protein [Maridesulfovibrio bastinii]|uniref:ParB/RepB/Spo0J family partition protein n=1 Tax=Maridesulfovibrio bastinii TaxID=47157 RepID=UPI0003F91100|nr:ParB/RepB/Spo0J family partition protein [Maridesulfovibrio bastinii]